MDRVAPTRHGERFQQAQEHWGQLKPDWHPRDPDRLRAAAEAAASNPHLLTPEEAWGFDVHGLLIIRGALQGPELAKCQALARQNLPPVGLATHPVAIKYVEQLCGKAWHLDQPVSLLELHSSSPSPYLLQGGGTPHEPSLAYHHQGGQGQPTSRWCQGLRLVWALADVPADATGGVVLLPASHTLNMPVPDAVRSGQAGYLESLGVELQPALVAGDLLIHAASLANGLRGAPAGQPALLCCAEYRAVYARPSDPSRDAAWQGDEPWLTGLGPAERAVLGLPPPPSYHASNDRVGSWPAVRSDGKEARLETATEVAARAGVPYHPGLLAKQTADAGEIDELEFFFWELTGFLVVRNALSASHLAAANAIVAKHLHTVDFASAAEQAEAGSRRMAGGARPGLDLMQLNEDDRAPFVEMLAHPVLVQRLNWMLGGHFRSDSIGLLILSQQGTGGQGLHGSGDPLYSNISWWDYTYDAGRLHTGQINVAWQLHDVGSEEQGFVVVPGSHHARLPLPSNDSGDPTGHKRVLHPRMKAGDLLLFAGGATTHGAWAWESELDRRVVLNAYWSRGMARQGWVRSEEGSESGSSKL